MDLDERVAAVRRFNRFYTKQTGLLQRGYLASPFSLTEVRVLYELAHRDKPTATELGKELGLDAGYLSRILRSFERQDLVARTPSESDGRQSVVALTRKGQREFATLHTRSRRDIAARLGRLPEADQDRLVDAMHSIEHLLGARAEQAAPYILRPHQVGDMGWVVHRHGVLYAREYGWDEQFEALVAGIVATFIRRFDPKHERCWIAERGGQNVASVLLVKRSKTVAQLRLLLVEPSARGLGIGARLVDETMRFARQAGYRKVVLWTNSVLVAARRIYQRAGFQLVHEEPHHSFGHDLVGQNWELTL